MGLARLVLWLSALCFIGFGLAFLFDPLGTFVAVAGIRMEGALAAAELRAFYGGFELGIGLLILATDRDARYRAYGLILVFAAFGGIAFGRSLGMLAGGVTTPFLWSALIIESTLAVAALLAWRGFHQSTPKATKTS